MPPSTFTGFKTIYRSIPAQRVRDAEDARCRHDLQSRLRAIVILAGGVRTDPLAQAARRARIGLPISAQQTLVCHWVDHARRLAQQLGLSSLELRLLLSSGHSLPLSQDEPIVRVTHRQDAASFRGTGGVLSDAAVDFQADDLLLIISGAQIMRQPLCDLAMNLARRSSPVTLAVHDNGLPCDVALATAGALQSIRAIGYVDFKEQGLIELAHTGSVDVAHCSGETTVPIRTFSQYLHALQLQHPDASEGGRDQQKQSFHSIVEPGACIGQRARLIDSVVLSGACIGDGAIVARCVVGPGAVIKRNACLVDQLIG